MWRFWRSWDQDDEITAVAGSICVRDLAARNGERRVDLAGCSSCRCGRDGCCRHAGRGCLVDAVIESTKSRRLRSQLWLVGDADDDDSAVVRERREIDREVAFCLAPGSSSCLISV
jgi:hypothetical protein